MQAATTAHPRLSGCPGQVEEREAGAPGLPKWRGAGWNSASWGASGRGQVAEREVAEREVAEREGFEPPRACALAVFKTAAINHSATAPRASIPAVLPLPGRRSGTDLRPGSGATAGVDQDAPRQSPV
jgi:hypothetical protein